MAPLKNKHVVTYIILCGVVFAVLFLGVFKTKDTQFNVILIVVDAMRADHLSAYGYSRNTTPNIDSLSQNSLFCLNAYSQSNWTCPSMASIFSGTYAQVHKVYNSPDKIKDRYSVLPEELTIIPEVFKQYSYTTKAVTSCGWVSENSNYDQGFDEFALVERNDKIIVDEAIRFINSRKYNGFFLYVHLLDLHDYFWMKKEHRMFVRPELELSDDMKSLSSKEPLEIYTAISKIKSKDDISQDDLDYLIDIYDSELHHSDELIGKLVQSLEEQDILDETVIIITADHGEMFLEHDSLLHGGGSLYNETIHIPLIFYNRKLFSGQKKVGEIVESIDIFPTILDLLDFNCPEIDGISQCQGRSIKEANSSKVAFVETSDRGRYKVIKDNWSYIFHHGGEQRELYDLENDPAETDNLAEEKHIIAKKMHRFLQKKIEDSLLLSQKIEPADAKIDEQVKRTLKALGYINPYSPY